MDNFLQLVPMVNDADSDPVLVYGEDELVVGDTSDGLEEHIQRHIAAQNEQDASLFELPMRQQSLEREDAGVTAYDEEANDLDSHERERLRYLKRARIIETHMEAAEREVQQRIDVMKRILELKDPMEQLSEYMALMLEERHNEDVDIVSELLQCAKNMTHEEDSEIALLGAFFFLCDPPRHQHRGMTAMLPVVAAMMEASSAMDHAFD